jgi:hypothetical protein
MINPAGDHIKYWLSLSMITDFVTTRASQWCKGPFTFEKMLAMVASLLSLGFWVW